MIRTNDRVLATRTEPDRVRFGDVVLYKSGTRLVTHRVLGKRWAQGELVFVEKGDASPLADLVSANRVLGRVEAVERNGRVIAITSGVGRAVQIALACHGLAVLLVRQGGERLLGRLEPLRGHGLGTGFERLASVVPYLLVRILRWG